MFTILLPILEVVTVYSAVKEIILRKLTRPYARHCIREENEEWGVYRCKEMVKSATPIDLGGSMKDSVTLDFNTALDPLGVILGKPVLHLTMREVHFLSEDEKVWDTPEKAGVIAHIKSAQLARTLVLQA